MFLRLFLNYVEIKTKKTPAQPIIFFIWIQSLLQQSSQSTMIYICQKFKDEQEIQELCREQETLGMLWMEISSRGNWRWLNLKWGILCGCLRSIFS